MEDAFFDVVTDLLKESMVGIQAETRKMFPKPYRMQKQTKQDRIAEYLTMPEEQKAYLRSRPELNFGKEEMEIQDMILRERKYE